MMTAEDALAQLGGTLPDDGFAAGWSCSGETIPAFPPAFAGGDDLLECCALGQVDPASVPSLERLCRRLGEDPALARVARHVRWRLAESPDGAPIREWPSCERLSPADRGLLFLLIGVSILPRIRAIHRARGIPEAISLDTLREVGLYSRDIYAPGSNGAPGMTLGQLNWMRHYVREEYYRIGRHEFLLGPSPGTGTVWRHGPTGATVALAAPGTRFNGDGTINADPNDPAGGPGFTAEYDERPDEVRGTRIEPTGRAIPGGVALSRPGWRPVLRKGDPTLHLHIPSGGGMTPEACRDSFVRGFEFFRERFPERPPVAIVCSSWIFGPPLQDIFPATSNLVRFQREVYLVPEPSNGRDGLFFVFWNEGAPFDIGVLPRKTSLQRGILDFLEAGGRWRHGGMFFLAEDLPGFGTSVYLNNRPPADSFRRMP